MNPLLLVRAPTSTTRSASRIHRSSSRRRALAALLERYREFETPWKYKYVRRLLADPGEGKIIIWSTFVRNLKSLATFLSDHEPALVHRCAARGRGTGRSRDSRGTSLLASGTTRPVVSCSLTPRRAARASASTTGATTPSISTWTSMRVTTSRARIGSTD